MGGPSTKGEGLNHSEGLGRYILRPPIRCQSPTRSPRPLGRGRMLLEWRAAAFILLATVAMATPAAEKVTDEGELR